MIDIEMIDFEKGNGLVPAVIQDVSTGAVLMLGYMNQEAVHKTINSGEVTFYSRSKKRLWKKGESSGNILKLEKLAMDCDKDTLLVTVSPTGPVCHEGSDTCWGQENKTNTLFLEELERTIVSRKAEPAASSYTSSLFEKGINKIAQKVGEEAVELVIEAKDDNRDLFLNEAADLMYHYTVLLAAKDVKFSEVMDVLARRSKA